MHKCLRQWNSKAHRGSTQTNCYAASQCTTVLSHKPSAFAHFCPAKSTGPCNCHHKVLQVASCPDATSLQDNVKRSLSTSQTSLCMLRLLQSQLQEAPCIAVVYQTQLYTSAASQQMSADKRLHGAMRAHSLNNMYSIALTPCLTSGLVQCCMWSAEFCVTLEPLKQKLCIGCMHCFCCNVCCLLVNNVSPALSDLSNLTQQLLSKQSFPQLLIPQGPI